MDKKKKIRYIKIREEQPKPAKKKKKSKAWKNFGNAMTIVGTTFSSMLLILVIMICIVVTVLAVYVLDFADTSYDANLRDVEMQYTSFVYAYDSDGNEVEIKRLSADQNRIWVDYEDISPNLVNAVVAVEDKRFYEHDGVDWQRTVFALGADVLNLDSAGQGGSTITQQLIKNITGDDEQTWERKLREIFRAMSLEEKYTKIDIIESYLNRIWFSRTYYGVGAASAYFFGKEASDLTIAESAILAGIIRSPQAMSPYVDLTRCKERQVYALECMYEQGYINTQEYESALVEKVQFAKVVYGDDFGYTDPRSLVSSDDDSDEEEDDTSSDSGYVAYKWNGDYTVTQNWYVDAAIDQVIDDYADEKGITYTSAKNELYNGGYKIYINENMNFQDILEEKYRDPYTVLSSYNAYADEEDLLQSAFVIMDYSGTVLAVAGGLGEKPGDGAFNRATMATRAPGSTMKPIGTYSTAIQKNLITYSTLIPDSPITIMNDEGTGTTSWPKNYNNEGGTGALMPVWEAIRYSRNTIAVRVCQMLTPQVVYNHLTQNLGITTLTQSDIAYSPITLGALTQGIKLYELAAAYQPFGNGGIYYEPKMYSKVEDSKGNIVLEQDFFGTQAIDSDTAWVTNRMLRTVVTSPTGTGHYAELDNVEVVGKTGTSNAMTDLLFVGCTPDYIGVLWIGYDDAREIGGSDGWKAVASVWKTVMQDIQDTSQVLKFTPDSSVVERSYCTETGLLATNKCTSVDTGYYRASNVPDFCNGDHEAIQSQIYAEWAATDAENAEKVAEQLRRLGY
jgi:penicillin-binding protein 1A